MRRLIIETDADRAAAIFGDPFFEKIDYMEVLSILRQDSKSFAGIFRIKFKDRKTKLNDFAEPSAQIQVIESGKDGSFTFYYRGKPNTYSSISTFWSVGGYLSTPFEIQCNRLRLSFLGSANEIRSFLKFLRKSGLDYKVDLLTDARFPPSSPLAKLTEKQRRVITTAFNFGYYDIPRKLGSTKLATKLGIGNPAFVMHRRKAERKILAELLSKS